MPQVSDYYHTRLVGNVHTEANWCTGIEYQACMNRAAFHFPPRNPISARAKKNVTRWKIMKILFPIFIIASSCCFRYHSWSSGAPPYVGLGQEFRCNGSIYAQQPLLSGFWVNVWTLWAGFIFIITIKSTTCAERIRTIFRCNCWTISREWWLLMIKRIKGPSTVNPAEALNCCSDLWYTAAVNLLPFPNSNSRRQP